MAESRFPAQQIDSPAWARYYSKRGTSFAIAVAPRIRALYESIRGEDAERSLLDVCCGQGNLARHFLDHGYRVTGIDLSEPMLQFARQNAGEHLDTGRARFHLADAANFSLDERFGLATSTFDALNMLQSLDALKSCFRCVRAALVDGGMFAFDLMTRQGFWRDFNCMWVADTEEELYVLKSVYNGGDKATTRMTGFVRSGDGTWERFEEFRTPTFFPADAVLAALEEAGWDRTWMASTDDLATAVSDPEEFDRVFFVAVGGEPR